ncbi:SDR family oxidoreductase [Streptomyces chartreusis]|uniref:SDR family oxidoreductase n=1 Tax=Streptomyces chartreusis TaxID=1969 RepID=UPI00382B0F9B
MGSRPALALLDIPARRGRGPRLRQPRHDRTALPGSTVDAIAPSMVRTATAERTVGAAGGFESVRERQVVPRTQEPSDLVSTLLYVVDEGSGFLAGQTLNVSGGSAFL